MKIKQSPLLLLIRNSLNPVIVIVTFLFLVRFFGFPLEGELFTIGILALLLVTQIMNSVDLESNSKGFYTQGLSTIFMQWFIVLAFILLIVFAAKLYNEQFHDLLLIWFIVTPLIMLFFQLIIRKALHRVSLTKDNLNKAVIVGVNDLSLKLESVFKEQSVLGIRCLGFFDGRNNSRTTKKEVLGGLSDVAGFVKINQIKSVYIAIPMSSQPRILALLDDLRDTTASVYYVPDVFLHDLIQSSICSIRGIPVITLCETPFVGVNGMIKRLFDIALSSVILILIAPLLLLIAVGIKQSSKGPVLFKQRRYGLDGEEIVVYKFRSMTVCEDNTSSIVQTTQNDSRVTRFGAFLRKTSLDELPQFINVLQGRMSIVGPRPHAVAHNELYRKQIKGYMVRHKVKPGITGWAQVNGYRGETDVIEKMESRILYDLDYLRNWSVAFDFFIILRTFGVFFYDKNAY